MNSIIKRDPFASIFSFPKWFDDISESTQRGLRVWEDKNNIMTEAVVAGVPADDVEVNIEDGILTIKAESKKEKIEDEEYVSSSYNYYYTTALSGGEWDKAKATIKNGIVKITIPKMAATKARSIKVEKE